MYGCTVIRRWLVTHGTLDIASGDLTTGGRQEWVKGPCGTPLFSDLERKRGECLSCIRGWTHPENYRVSDADQQAAA